MKSTRQVRMVRTTTTTSMQNVVDVPRYAKQGNMYIRNFEHAQVY